MGIPLHVGPVILKIGLGNGIDLVSREAEPSQGFGGGQIQLPSCVLCGRIDLWDAAKGPLSGQIWAS